MTTQELRDKRGAAWAQAVEYRTRAEAGEEMTAEDEGAWKRALDDVDALKAQIDVRERDEKLSREFDEIDERNGGGQPPVTPGGGEHNDRDAYDKAFGAFIRTGMNRLDADQRGLLTANAAEIRAQAVGTGSAGGYTVPQGFWAKIVETLKFYGGVISVAEVLNTDTGNDIPFPTNDDTANVGALLAENTQISAGDLTFGQKTLHAYTYTSLLILASLQFLQDTGVDAEGFIARKIGERLGRIYNRQFTTGTGSSQPQGWVTGASTGKTTASATAITYGEIVDLIHSVDVAYRGNARFQMHDLILAYVRKLTDSQNRPLWQPAITEGVPDTLLGYGITVNNDMDSAVTTTKKTMGFGDFRSMYVVRQVAGGQLMRLEERYADYLQVGFFGFGRADGLVQDASAAKLLVQT